MVEYIVYYFNGVHDIIQFKDEEEAEWFFHMEGDHVIDYKKLEGDVVQW